MTWGRYDDRAPFHRKWLTLSNDAVATMWRATQWARSPEASARPGFLTRDELRVHSRLKGKKFESVLRELITAGRPAHVFGLLEETEDGFLIHDFDDYGPRSSKSEDVDDSAAARRADAARRAGEASAAARKARNGSAQPKRRTDFETEEPQSGVHPTPERPSNDSRTSSERPAEQNAERPSNDSRTPGPDPEESLPATAAAKDQTGSAREAPRSEAAAAAPAAPDKVCCPDGLELTDSQVKQLREAGVPDYAIQHGRAQFLLGASSQEPRSLAAWQTSMARAIQGNWNDPKKRPKSPEEQGNPGVSKTNGGGEVSWWTTADGKRHRARY